MCVLMCDCFIKVMEAGINKADYRILHFKVSLLDLKCVCVCVR